MSKTFQFQASLPPTSSQEIRDFLASFPSTRTYCVSFELGTETEKEHWQGWIETPAGCVKNDQKKCKEWFLSKNLKGSSNEWAASMIKNLDPTHPKNWYSYILANEQKVLTDVIHNIENIDEFKKSLVLYLNNKKKAKARSFNDDVYEYIESKVVTRDQDNKVKIEYDQMKFFMMEKYGKYLKDADSNLLNRKLFGCSNYLEQKYGDSLAHERKGAKALFSKLDPLFQSRDYDAEIALLKSQMVLPENML